MNIELNSEGDIDENNFINRCSTSNSTLSNASRRSPSISTTNDVRKQQKGQCRVFPHDPIVTTNNNDKNNHRCSKISDNPEISLLNNDNIAMINEENSSLMTNINEENQGNKILKRKVVSFSTMPSEKKVADSKLIFCCC